MGDKSKMVQNNCFGKGKRFFFVLVCLLVFFWGASHENVLAANPANAPESGSIVAGYLNDPDFENSCAGYHYQAPDGTVKAVYTSVADMRANAAGYEAGDYIQTQNYYEGVTGGGAVYEVERSASTMDNGGTIIDLPGDIRCKLVSGNNTVSPLQFGACGDGITDDHDALEAAFCSGFGTIILEGRTYISNDTIWIDVSDITIEGMKATITCDDNFGGLQTAGKENANQFYFTNCKNITIRHLLIKDGQTTGHDRGSVAFQSVSNLELSWCTIEIPKWNTAYKENCASTVSFANGWHDVSVTHCEITNMAGVKVGGAIGFNDVYASGSDGALIENNVIRYNVKDEVIAVFSHSREGSDYFKSNSYIRNVKICHNEFYAPKSDNYTRDLAFSIGYDDSLEVDNIVYEENYFEVDAVWAFMSFSESAANCTARGNVIRLCQTSGRSSLSVFKGVGKTRSVVEDNLLVISTENEFVPECIAMGMMQLRNNQVTADCSMNCLFEYGAVSEENRLQINGDVKKAVAFQGGDMKNTDITITGGCGSLYESYQMVMQQNILWEKNNIQLPSAVSTGSILNFNGMTMNGYTFTLRENVVLKPNATQDDGLIYDAIMDEEKDEQKIIMEGNRFQGYYCKEGKPFLYRVKNELISYDKTVIKDYEVVFDLDGKGEAASQSAIEGETVKEPEIISLPGYQVLGWYKDKSFEIPWNFETDVITDNTTIYARLEKLVEEIPDGEEAGGEGSILPMLPDEQLAGNAASERQTIKKPAKVKGVKLKQVKTSTKAGTKRKVKITWKSAEDVTGYQIFVSTNKGKKYKKVKAISAKKKCSYTYTSKKGKTLYVKIRGYSKQAGNKKYGAFSTVKKITLK